MRDYYWDNWKGLAIIAVVMIHVLGQTASFPLDSLNNLFGVFFRQFINFPVAMFFFFSGYFTPKDRPSNYIEFYKKRMVRILIPYLVWTAIYIPIYVLNGSFSVSKIASYIFLGTGISIGYFVIALAQLIIITPLLYIVKSKGWQTIFVAISLITSIVFTYYFQLESTSTKMSQYPLNAIPFFVWLPFYALGFYISKSNNSFNIKSNKLLICYCLFVILSLLEASYWMSTNRDFSVSQLKVTSYFASIAICLYAVSRHKKANENSYMAWLGKSSYFIYLSHIFVLTFVSAIIKKISFIYNSSIFYFVIVSFCVIILCVLIKIILNRLTPSNIADKFFG
ncbi:acyltransferase [Providencia rettgeri]|uniref:acyltransferase n=1 Tax=Providencia rettgeri TaxID=587 RepID=UPI002361C09F|nr:acyltransferase [Providencia rettgeri]